MLRRQNYASLICRIYVQHRNFGTTFPTLLNQKYRKERGLPLNPNASGILTDSADYSFLDGRLTPLGKGQRLRLVRQQEVKQQIILLSKEIDFAIERHTQMKLDEENKKQQIIDSKLKPKGMALLKST